MPTKRTSKQTEELTAAEEMEVQDAEQPLVSRINQGVEMDPDAERVGLAEGGPVNEADVAAVEANEAPDVPHAAPALNDDELGRRKAEDFVQAQAGIPANEREMPLEMLREQILASGIAQMTPEQRQRQGINLPPGVLDAVKTDAQEGGTPGMMPDGSSSPLQYEANERAAAEAGPRVVTTFGDFAPLRDPRAIADKLNHPTPVVELRTPVLIPQGDLPEDADERIALLERRLAAAELFLAAILTGPAGGVIRIARGDLLRIPRGKAASIPEYNEEADNFYITLRDAERGPLWVGNSESSSQPTRDIAFAHSVRGVPQSHIEGR